ncbi:MAG: hypothetical protein GDA35_01740 [Hyphomonadaceae bacterium]|nr:hypothetical protein [Hyphomonadaceae bacterium]
MIEDHDNPFAEIIYHFDLPANSLPLKQFIDTASASQSILDDFNKNIFGNKVEFEIRVRPSEKGGFIEVLAVIISGGVSLLAFLGTDIGKSYFKGLTGKKPSEWAKDIGEKHRKWLENLKRNNAEENTEIISAPEPVIGGERISDEERDAAALAELLVGFLAADADKLQQAGLTPEKFSKAFEARNAIYEACIGNPDVKGLGFDRSHDFPIKRSDFPKLITQIPDQVDTEADTKVDTEADTEADTEGDTPMSWNVETVDIVVNSPNWKRGGRKWQAATNKRQNILFSVEDDSFWHHVETKDIQPGILDKLRVQWAYPAGPSKSPKFRVLRVLSYNGRTISDPIPQDELSQELKEARVIKPQTLPLFD